MQTIDPRTAIGFLIGRVKFGSFSLGIVVGTLLAGVLIGQLDIKVPAIVKTIFFDLFLFTTGYKVGPQFFRGLKRDALCHRQHPADGLGTGARGDDVDRAVNPRRNSVLLRSAHGVLSCHLPWQRRHCTGRTAREMYSQPGR